jgi:hypothetical protein
MPSTSDPLSSVNPGPGKLSVGTVPASALLAPSGGGGGAALASQVSWVGDGPWLDGTTNPATNVGAQLTKFITDLTNLTRLHSAADRISGTSPTTATLANSNTVTGGTLQALLENLITQLGSPTGTQGMSAIGASSLDVAFVDGLAPSLNTGAGTLQNLLDQVIRMLAQETSGTAMSIVAGGPNVLIQGINLGSNWLNYYGWNITVYDSVHAGNNGTFPLTPTSQFSASVPGGSWASAVTDIGVPLSGTFSVVGLSPNVTATTSQTGVIIPGDIILFDCSGTYYSATVLSVTGTAIVLTANFPGPTTFTATGSLPQISWALATGSDRIGARQTLATLADGTTPTVSQGPGAPTAGSVQSLIESFVSAMGSQTGGNAQIVNVANNGSGLIRVTLASSVSVPTGSHVIIQNVSGAGEANGLWVVTQINAYTYDLQSSTFNKNYIGGGTFQYGTLVGTTVLDVSNNGGLIQIHTQEPLLPAFPFSSVLYLVISGAVTSGGMVLNGGWAATRIDSTHYTLFSSTYTGSYTAQSATASYFSTSGSDRVGSGAIANSGTGLSPPYNLPEYALGVQLSFLLGYINDRFAVRKASGGTNLQQGDSTVTLTGSGSSNFNLQDPYTRSGQRIYLMTDSSVSTSSAVTLQPFNGTGGAVAVSNIVSGAGGQIEVFTASHTFVTHGQVTISGVTGTTEANGTFFVTVIDSFTFLLDGTTFVNAYVSGGTAKSAELIQGHTTYPLTSPNAQYILECDGTSWYVLQGRTPYSNTRVCGPSTGPYSLDSAGYDDATVFLQTGVAAITFTLPDLTAGKYAGRRVAFIDQTGNLGTYPFLLLPTGSQTINGTTGPYLLDSAWGTWQLTSDGTNWFVSSS